MIRVYIMLTKPGIILGNLVTTLGGFALAYPLATQGSSPWRSFFAAFLGLALLIASAGVFNNCIDRERDRKMERTQKRALAQGIISFERAFWFGALLLVSAALILGLGTPLATLWISLSGFLTYVFLYSFLKPKSRHGTWVGSLAGATPPVVGYTAASGSLDLSAILLFLVLFCWQMPHFFAIALYRLDDYRKAEVPVLPLVKGIHATQVQMLLYVVAFALSTFALGVAGGLGSAYFIVASLLASAWLLLSIEGFFTFDPLLWGRHTFSFSLLAIVALFGAIGIDRLLF